MPNLWGLDSTHQSKYEPFAVSLNEVNNRVSPEVQILRVGKFSHPVYGVIDITPQTLAELKINFDEKVRGVDIALDYFHENDKTAAGWVKALELREGGNELWAVSVDWTPRARKMLAEKELRYFSPEFGNWKDPETGVLHRNVLNGGGLTNRPFVKGMAPIVSLSEDQIKKALADDTDIQKCVADMVPNLMAEGRTFEEAKAIAHQKCGEEQLATLEAETPDVNLAAGYTKTEKEGDSMLGNKEKMEQLEAALAEKTKQCETLSAENTKLKTEHTAALTEKDNAIKLSETKVKELEAQKEKTAKEQEFAKMLSEGKAVAAQKDAFMKGDFAEFVKLSQPVNLEGKGHSGAANETGDAADQAIKLAEKLAKEEKITFGEAQSRVLKEHPELAKQLGQTE